MKYKFNKNVYLFLIGSVTLGISQAFMMLFLNFYLRALGLGGSWQGVVNAIPAVTSALLSLPAVYISKRLSESYTLKLGSFLGVIGTICIALSNGGLMAIFGSIITGVGGAFMMVSNAPFMASQTTEETRVPLFSIQMALMTGAGFLGNIVGGRIPQIYANISNNPANSIPALRVALITAAIIQTIGFLALLMLKNNRSKEEILEHKESGVSPLKIVEKKKLLKLILPNMIVGAGAGATIPYLNLFIEGKFHISYSSLGMLFGWTSLATAVTILIQPYLVKKFGQIKTILLVQIASMPFMAILGFAPYLWIVIIALFTRGALMNAGSPVYAAHAMSKLSEQDRPMYSAANLIGWNGAWAISASLSGVLRQSLGQEKLLLAFNILFIFSMVMYALSIYCMYKWLYLPDKIEADKKLSEKNILNNDSVTNEVEPIEEHI